MVISLSSQECKDGILFLINGLLQEHVLPVILNDEWFDAFGFERIEAGDFPIYKKMDNGFTLKHIGGGYYKLTQYEVPITESSVYVHDVHHLQNLYIDMMDSKLILKQHALKLDSNG